MTCPKAADGLRRSANKSDDSVAIPRDEAIIRPVSFDLSSGLVRLYSPRSRRGVSNKWFFSCLYLPGPTAHRVEPLEPLFRLARTRECELNSRRPSEDGKGA